MDLHRLTCELVYLANEFSKNIAKICQALRLTYKVSSFQLDVKFTCFNFLAQIFAFFSAKH